MNQNSGFWSQPPTSAKPFTFTPAEIAVFFSARGFDSSFSSARGLHCHQWSVNVRNRCTELAVLSLNLAMLGNRYMTLHQLPNLSKELM